MRTEESTQVRGQGQGTVSQQAADDYSAAMQYTIRNIPKKLDQALRRRAKEQKRSLNDIVIEALSIVAGLVPGKSVRYRDLSDLAGTYVHDPGFEAGLQEQDQIDPRGWE